MTIALVYTRIRKKIVLILTNTSTCIHTRIHKSIFFLRLFIDYKNFHTKIYILRFTYEYIQIQSNLHTQFDFYNAKVASRDLQRNSSFQPTHLHHLAMCSIIEKLKKGDKQFFNMSDDLPNEFSNGIKLQLKIDQ